MGADPDLAQRRLAHPAPPRAQYPRSAPASGRRLRSPRPSPTTTTSPRAASAGGQAGRAGPDGLLLHRPAGRQQGHLLAIHRRRRLQRLHLGLRATTKNPLARHTSALAHLVARDLAARGWKLERVMSDNGSEFRAKEFEETVHALHVKHTFIHAGRSQTNGCVERAQRRSSTGAGGPASPAT